MSFAAFNFIYRMTPTYLFDQSVNAIVRGMNIQCLLNYIIADFIHPITAILYCVEFISRVIVCTSSGINQTKHPKYNGAVSSYPKAYCDTWLLLNRLALCVCFAASFV